MLDLKIVDLEYQISEGDFMDAYEVFWRSRKHGSKSELIWGAVAVVFGVILLYVGYLIGWALVASGVMLAALIPLRHFLHKRAYRENPVFAGSTSVSFGEEHIQVANPLGESRLKWSFYRSAMESDAFFMPMISKRSFSIIPKRSFASEEEMASFRDLLESKLGEIKRI